VPSDVPIAAAEGTMMQRDSLEPIEPKGQEESDTPAWGNDPAPAGTAQAAAIDASPAATSGAISETRRTTKAARKPPTSKGATRSGAGVSPFLIAFVVGIFGVLLLTVATAFGVSQAYENRVLPGVHVGTVDLSGSNRDEAIRKLTDAYSSLALGEITVATPNGTETISYGQVGRAADVNAMADEALAVGHDGNALSSGASMLHTVISGDQLPVLVKLNPQELATRLHDITLASSVVPTDAKVTFDGKNFVASPAAPGRGVDELTIANWLIQQLSSSTAPNKLSTDPTYAVITPKVTDQDAQTAIAEAKNMVVDLTVTQGSQSWTIAKAKVQKWIMFGTAADGTYRPAIDTTLATADIQPLEPKVDVPAVEPTIISDKSGKPVGVANGQNGITLDAGGTAQAVAIYLNGLAKSPTSGPYSVALVTQVTQPRLASNFDPSGFVIIGQHTTIWFPGESNGNGANIRTPAKVLNGQVIAPGQSFSFLQSVGPIDPAHGFALGGVIVDGKSNHTGAMGGGICSASTTLFNAVAKAGLKVDERHQHFYYINRYPMGLDATVYSNGQTTWDMRWTNDTPYPIIIRGWATNGRSQASITFQLWSVPTGRHVVFSKPTQANIVKATSTTRYVSTLKPGATYHQEYATQGFDTFVTRTVTDSTGAVLYFDKWYSHYGVVNGVLQIGGTPPPAHTPPPASTPTPAPSVSPRRRKLVPAA
jgi:vancomycin resistance protein YoaR